MSTRTATMQTERARDEAQQSDRSVHGSAVSEGTSGAATSRGRAVSASGKPPCVEHGTLCVFHGDEPGRCPWCHGLWTVILGRNSHSCESASLWRGVETRWRVIRARQMREEAARKPQGLDHGGHGLNTGMGATKPNISRGRRHTTFESDCIEKVIP
jgi:hypothetical protein